MEIHGWSDGLALRPRDYLPSGRPLLDVVRAAGPFRGETLHALALGTAATMARLHLAGIAGLRLGPDNVLLGRYGQALFAPGPRDSEFPSHDVRAWAEVMIFAATGTEAGEGPGLDRLPAALRTLVGACLQADPDARPTAAELVAGLLGRPAPGGRAQVERLLREAESRTRPYQPPAYEETLVSTPLWRRPAFLAGVALGLVVVALLAGAVVLVSALAAAPVATGTGGV
ncbi:hypothetical protein Nocox_03430 [Nonomuraea coxensis DSM 45129]|uniref:Protein kinase domain-containing protein n=1 Tax=Nonomuraea coxensis DSM 45129 TaxID=1122611 RepID=A0ABX8TS66_9ACTN|nr:hypothetical protein [Nonomuraea coxensis]QYC38315.1 hypothetical protein Nocox_03430 [Nonomuraea coxensis DSM 45129]